MLLYRVYHDLAIPSNHDRPCITVLVILKCVIEWLVVVGVWIDLCWWVDGMECVLKWDIMMDPIWWWWRNWKRFWCWLIWPLGMYLVNNEIIITIIIINQDNNNNKLFLIVGLGVRGYFSFKKYIARAICVNIIYLLIYIK